MRFFVLLFACFGITFGITGSDSIQTISESGFKCLKSNGHSFFIARVYKSDGTLDEVGVQNLINARETGWEFYDAYMFPCLRKDCPSAADQVETVISRLDGVDAR
uniref:Lysozyme n=1 Tax=Panagrolaimus sp. JU765 TaxID=591449 RepID=A0AC34RMA7_9BILA